MARVDAIGCFALTEPRSGSDPSSMTTRAVRDGSDWVLTRHKKWNTNGWVSDVSIVWAKDERGVIRGFVVPSDTPGLEFAPLEHAWSLGAAAHSELHLRDVHLRAEAVLPGIEGIKGHSRASRRRGSASRGVAMGAARACYEAALHHATSRVQFGKPIGAFQLVQPKLVEMAIAVNAGSLMAQQLGRLKDAGQVTFEQVSMTKLHNARAALTIAREARSLLGRPVSPPR